MTQSSKFPALVIMAFAAVIALCAVALLCMQPERHAWESSVKPGDADTILGADPRTLENPKNINDKFLFKETVHHADGVTPRITKIVYDNRMPHLVRTSVPYVLYEFYRADGTLEKDYMVFPESGLGGGVNCKYCERFFDNTGKKELSYRYIREDGTTGVTSDHASDTFTTYRADGKTLRSVQQRLPDGTYRTTYYRLDGKTEWWVSDHGGTAKVYFDYQGNPVKKQFTSKSLTGSFSMGPSSPPIPYREDTYTRPDGTVEYKQTWHAVYDEDYFQGLSQVELYAADGKTLTHRVHLMLRHPRKGLFVQSVEIFNADGTRLVRNYRSPDSRESEELFGADGSSLGKTEFPGSDRFSEKFEDMIFRGFHLQTHPEHDTDIYDI